jgi:hypothetical protein
MSDPATSLNPPTRWSLFLVRAGIALTILAIAASWMATAIDQVQESADRITCNLSQLGHTLRLYHDAHDGLPPAILYDTDGKPLHSWRVLILPYMEEEKLFKEFRLHEPWDSPYNIKLLPRMPRTYAEPRRRTAKLPPYHTVFHVFVGRGSAFEEQPKPKLADRFNSGPIDLVKLNRGLKIPDDFPDGTEDTLLFVEAGEPVPWTKPQELRCDTDNPLPDLTGLFRDGFRACTVEGRYRFIRNDTPEATLRALISRNGGEPLPADW